MVQSSSVLETDAKYCRDAEPLFHWSRRTFIPLFLLLFVCWRRNRTLFPLFSLFSLIKAVQGPDSGTYVRKSCFRLLSQPFNGTDVRSCTSCLRCKYWFSRAVSPFLCIIFFLICQAGFISLKERKSNNEKMVVTRMGNV